MVETVFFWIPIFLIFHSYVLFPAMLHLLVRKKHNQPINNQNLTHPFVSVIISVYNEETVLEQRIRNIFHSNYPADKLELLIGSDGSIDNTNVILYKLQQEYPSLRIFIFKQRKGKGAVINSITNEAKGNILLLTDAKVQFTTETIANLTKHFHNPEIGIVGGNIVNRHFTKEGISIPERLFMSREVVIKYNEGVLWGALMGAYGACYAIRKELLETIPEGFSVEDFYITLSVLVRKYKGILDLDAICYEDVPERIDEEFRRKVRISSGNFQNMKTFFYLVFKFNPLSFCFFSHKIIRWTGPFLLLIILLSNILIVNHSFIYGFTLRMQLILLIVPVIDFFLQKIHIHIIPLRFVTHFFSMNLALFLGFVKYLKGVKTNVWEPTKRAFKQT